VAACKSNNYASLNILIICYRKLLKYLAPTALANGRHLLEIMYRHIHALLRVPTLVGGVGVHNLSVSPLQLEFGCLFLFNAIPSGSS
jgi:hypothetical protein